MANHIRSPRKMAQGLRNWASLALQQRQVQQENEQQAGMFGPQPVLSRQEIMGKLGDESITEPQHSRKDTSGGTASPTAHTGTGSSFASAIPRGLPARTDADSRRLAQGINQWLQRNGRGSGFDAQTVQQESLPDAIASALTAFEQATGTRVVVFRNLTPDVDDFNGVNFGDGVVYVNEDSQNPIISTASHEWLHHLRKTQPLLYQQLADEVERQGNLHGYQQRLKNDGESSWQDMDVVTEELTAAATGDAMTDAEFLQRIAQSNRGLFQRVAQSFLKFLDTLTGRWRNQGSNQYLQDVQAFRDKLAHVLQQLETSSTPDSTQDTDAEAQEGAFSRKDVAPTEFIPNPSGKLDYGEITPEMGRAMRRQAGKIRLQQGVQNPDGTGWGLSHIEANHGRQIRNAGFDSVQDFVSQIASNFNEILQAPKGRQLLVAVSTGRQDVMFIQLEAAPDGDFYRVNTAFPTSRNYLEKQEGRGAKILWNGSEPRPTVTGQQSPYADSPEVVSGQDAPIALGEKISNASNLSTAGGNVNSDDVRFSRKASRNTPRDTPPDVQPHIDRLAAHAQNIRNQRAQALQQAQHEAQRPITDKARTATHEAAQAITGYARQALHDFQTQREHHKNQTLPFARNAQGHLTFTPGQAAWDWAKAITGPILNRFGMKNASPQLRQQLREMRRTIEQAQRKAANVAHAMQVQTDELRASLRLNSPLLPVAD